MSAQLRNVLLPLGVDGAAASSDAACRETDTKRNILHALWEYVRVIHTPPSNTN
jgi:hypothetical protein